MGPQGVAEVGLGSHAFGSDYDHRRHRQLMLCLTPADRELCRECAVAIGVGAGRDRRDKPCPTLPTPPPATATPIQPASHQPQNAEMARQTLPSHRMVAGRHHDRHNRLPQHRSGERDEMRSVFIRPVPRAVVMRCALDVAERQVVGSASCRERGCATYERLVLRSERGWPWPST